MKSDTSLKKFPVNQEEWEKLIAEAPGEDRPLTEKERTTVARAVVVKTGGYEAVQAALAKKRMQGQRGPQKRPVKQSISIRYSPEVVEYFKSTGQGWQTRMNDALKEWVFQHNKV